MDKVVESSVSGSLRDYAGLSRFMDLLYTSTEWQFIRREQKECAVCLLTQEAQLITVQTKGI